MRTIHVSVVHDRHRGLPWLSVWPAALPIMRTNVVWMIWSDPAGCGKQKYRILCQSEGGFWAASTTNDEHNWQMCNHGFSNSRNATSISHHRALSTLIYLFTLTNYIAKLKISVCCVVLLICLLIWLENEMIYSGNDVSFVWCVWNEQCACIGWPV